MISKFKFHNKLWQTRQICQWKYLRKFPENFPAPPFINSIKVGQKFWWPYLSILKLSNFLILNFLKQVETSQGKYTWEQEGRIF